MTAVSLEQPDAATAVAKEHEVLAHNPNSEREVFQIFGIGHGLPEPSQILPARRPGTNVGEFFVLPRNLAAVIRAVRLVQERPVHRHGVVNPLLSATRARRAYAMRTRIMSFVPSPIAISSASR
jgi:hypothetical protein